jgi:hypothetical protein
LQTIINPKNKNYYIFKPCIQFRQIPTVKRKNQNSRSDINILESIKEEDSEIFEDIETGKIKTNTNKTNTNKTNKTNTNKTNTNVYLYLINLQNIIITSVFYISHIVFIVFLFRV